MLGEGRQEVWGPGRVHYTISEHMLAFCSLYINSLMANVTNLLNMREALYHSSSMALWKKRSEWSQNESLDPRGRKKSRTSACAIKTPKCGPRHTMYHWNCTPTIGPPLLPSDYIREY